MLKDVGVRVPIIGETSAVARQGLRAYNNNMYNPSLHLMGLDMLLTLAHAREGYCSRSVCVCGCVCVCLSVCKQVFS